MQAHPVSTPRARARFPHLRRRRRVRVRRLFVLQKVQPRLRVLLILSHRVRQRVPRLSPPRRRPRLVRARAVLVQQRRRRPRPSRPHRRARRRARARVRLRARRHRAHHPHPRRERPHARFVRRRRRRRAVAEPLSIAIVLAVSARAARRRVARFPVRGAVGVFFIALDVHRARASPRRVRVCRDARGERLNRRSPFYRDAARTRFRLKTRASTRDDSRRAKNR